MSIKNKIYNITRNYVKKLITNKLGKVVEEDDKLICYVDKSKCKRNNSTYTIRCYGMGGNTRDFLAESYNLNKPIHYIIDGLDFGKNLVYIFGYFNSEVTIRNCKFGFHTDIYVNGKCTMENNLIEYLLSLRLSANELIIKNSDIKNNFGSIRIEGNEKLETIDLNIDDTNKVPMFGLISNNEIKLTNSKICADIVYLKTNKIISDNSSLNGNLQIEIQADDLSSINVNAPKLICNGKIISNQENNIELNPLTEKRLELLELLKKLKSKCTQINEEKANSYKESLNSDSISRTLIRK